MSVGVPALPLGVDPLIAEAKRRARRRRLLAAAGLVLAIGAVTGGILAFGAGGSSGEIPWLPTRPNVGPAHPPLAPACTASQLGASLFLQGATQSLAGGITVVNRSKRACALTGRPKLSFPGETAAWRETRWSRGTNIPFDPLAPPFGSLRALSPGRQVSVGVWWSNWCGPRPEAMVLTAPGGGSIRLHNGPDKRLGAPVCNGGISMLQATKFTPYVPVGPPSSALPLKASIVSGGPVTVKGKTLTQPSFVARPGSWLSFTLLLTNRGERAYRFGRTCPAYTEDWGGLARAQAYVLNCHAVGSIAPGRSVAFAMRIRVPNTTLTAPAFAWTLAPHTYKAPSAMAVVQLH